MANFVDPGVPFVSDEAREEYTARATRVKKAMLLEGTPDRVPVAVLAHFYPALRAGLSFYDAMYDYRRAADAWIACNREIQPDTLIGMTASAIPGRAFETLDVKLFNWPGHGVSHDSGFQYNEKEWMRDDEYDLLIDDPTDYLLHTYLPRAIGGMAGFASLVSPLDMVEISVSAPYISRWNRPEVVKSMESMRAAGRECDEWAAIQFGAIGQLVTEGFPGATGAMSLAPFDFIGDTLRGTRGVIMDMFRRPDELLEACDKLSRVLVKWITRRAFPQQPPCVFIPLHKGADGFMSDEQFNTFYWPSLKKVILGLVEDGFVPYLFAEGAYGSRLDIIKDLPAGKTVWQFDQTDMVKAKEAMGGVACIQGNVPLSLLQLGEPEEVTAYSRDLIEKVGPGGGFILDVGAAPDEVKDENIVAMIKAAKDYGWY